MFRKIVFFLLFAVSLFAEEPYIIFLVNARQLDYSSNERLLKTIAKHPSDWSKNGDVGHAWIYLFGDTIIEGGHSGELGIDQPRYMEGVIDNMALGAKDPISYLWCSQCDGFFQKGNGGHRPTTAAKLKLTQTQYETIKAFIERYPYREYSLRGNQCCTFVKQIAALVGIVLEDQVTVQINPKLWKDPAYKEITFGSPDRLEASLREQIRKGVMVDALRDSIRMTTHKS